MSDFEIFLSLGVALGLLSFLCLKHRARVRLLAERNEAVHWQGTSIDASKLVPALKTVRLDFTAASRLRTGFRFHERLVGLARRTVAHYAYFQEQEAKSQGQNEPGWVGAGKS